MARYSKKHAREVRRDRFREETLSLFDRLGDRLEGRGRQLLYALGGLALAGVLAYSFWSWRERKANEARQALGRAIEIASAPVTTTPVPGATGPSFTSERERAERAVEEFQKVANKYGDPFRAQANYLKASNLLLVDRGRGVSELEALAKGGERDISAWAKFLLAQARESDGDYDRAAALYRELSSGSDPVIPADMVKVRLAGVLEKQGRKQEAADLLFQIVKASREAKDQDGKPAPPSAAARDAEKKLEALDPARHAQLPPEPPRGFPS